MNDPIFSKEIDAIVDLAPDFKDVISGILDSERAQHEIEADDRDARTAR